MGYAAGEFHCLVDGDLYLPERWDRDRRRCRAAGIPDEVVYRPKSEIALELYDRARANGVHFEWLKFDEWCGSKPPFLRALDQRQQKIIGEVHKGFVAWIDPPEVVQRRERPTGPGQPRKTPRLQDGSPKAQTVEQLAKSQPSLRNQRWQTWRIKDVPCQSLLAAQGGKIRR